jgi:hypothetical protein
MESLYGYICVCECVCVSLSMYLYTICIYNCPYLCIYYVSVCVCVCVCVCVLRLTCEIRGSQSGIPVDTAPLGCDAMRFTTFRSIVMPSPSRVKESKRQNGTLKREGISILRNVVNHIASQPRTLE